jgi:purine catabolism regulator
VHRFQGDLVSDLVAGAVDRSELERRARRMNLDLEVARFAIAFSPVTEESDDPSARPQVLATLRRRLARVLTTHEVQPPSHVEDDLLILFYPAQDDLTPPAAKRLAERLQRDLADAVSRYRLYAGVSRVHGGLQSFRVGFHEARRALELGCVLVPDRHVTHFADLGLHRLLFALRETDEMQEFYDDMLGRLARYDEEKGAELVATLDAYLCAHNATEVAARLNLHRNSLLYRLRRIQEITGLDLDDPETRLALHLACRIGEALRARVALGA